MREVRLNLLILFYFLSFIHLRVEFIQKNDQNPLSSFKFKAILLVNPMFTHQKDWSEKAIHFFQRATQILEKEVQIAIDIDRIDIWKEEGTSLQAMAQALDRELIRGKKTIVVAFLALPGFTSSLFGFSLVNEGIVVVRIQEKEELTIQALLHELAHLFGAVHLNEASSVMDLWNRGGKIDSLNLEIMKLYRDRTFNDFRFPLKPEKRGQAISLYQKIALSLQPLINQAIHSKNSSKKIANSLEDVFLSLAQLELEERNYAKVLEWGEQALKINPNSLEALNLMAIAKRRRGEIDEAIALYQKILATNPQEAKIYYNLGIALSKKGELLAALQAYERALNLKPNMVEALGNKADVLIRLGREEEAEQILKKALFLREDFALGWANLAEIYYRKKDYGLAQKCVEQALFYDPELAEGHNMRGKLFHQKGLIDEAIKSFSLALELDPFQAKAAHNLGNCYLELDRLAEAQDFFKKALSLSPQMAEAYEGLGICQLLLKRVDEALPNLLKAKELGLNTLSLNLNLTTAFIQKGMWKEATQAAEEALRLDPQSALAWNNLGLCALQKQDYGQAEKCFRQALSLDAQNRQALTNLGTLLISLAKWNEAAEIYERLLQSFPNEAISHNNLAYIYYRLGNYSKAWMHLEKALSLGLKVDPEFIDEIKRRIKNEF